MKEELIECERCGKEIFYGDPKECKINKCPSCNYGFDVYVKPVKQCQVPQSERITHIKRILSRYRNVRTQTLFNHLSKLKCSYRTFDRDLHILQSKGLIYRFQKNNAVWVRRKVEFGEI